MCAGICALRALSPAGRCRTFDAAADGYGRGEGFAAVVLGGVGGSTSSVLALLPGSAVGHGGRAAALTAPSGPAQAALVRAALASARSDPAAVAAVAVHGTGTALGDPLELGALATALGGEEGGASGARSLSPTALVSTKAVYGHTEGAAGVAGALMAAAVAGDAITPPVAGLSHVNPHAGAALAAWRAAAAPRGLGPTPGSAGPSALVGSSSFGMSGVNAHALVAAGAHARARAPRLPWRRAAAWHGPHLHRLVHPAPGESPGVALFTASLDEPALAYVRAHAVSGAPLVPATASLEAAAAAATALLFGVRSNRRPLLLGIAFAAPLRVDKGGSIVVRVWAADGSVAVGAGGGQAAVAASVRGVEAADADRRPRHRRPGRALAGRSRRRARRGGGALARTATPPAAGDYHAHPALADAALHLDAVRAGGGAARVPARVGAALAGGRGGEGGGGWATAHASGRAADVSCGNALAVRGMQSVQAVGSGRAALGVAGRARPPPTAALEWQAVEPMHVAGVAFGRVRAMTAADALRAAATGARSLLAEVASDSGPAGPPRAAATAAAAAAVLRVASSEGAAPGAAFGWGPTCEGAVAAALRGDEFGARADGGPLCLPRLMRDIISIDPRRLTPARPAVVVGGAGGLGRLLASYLVAARSSLHVTLVSRSAVDAVDPLGAGPAVVVAVAADAATAAGAAAVAALAPPTTAIFLAAAARTDALVGSQSPTKLRQAAAPKAVAAAALSRAAAGTPFSAVVALSSVAGLLGSAGQASYAAASAGLDAWVARGRAEVGRRAKVEGSLWLASSRSAVYFLLHSPTPCSLLPGHPFNFVTIRRVGVHHRHGGRRRLARAPRARRPRRAPACGRPRRARGRVRLPWRRARGARGGCRGHAPARGGATGGGGVGGAVDAGRRARGGGRAAAATPSPSLHHRLHPVPRPGRPGIRPGCPSRSRHAAAGRGARLARRGRIERRARGALCPVPARHAGAGRAHATGAGRRH